jgi:peroxiredoxin
MRYTLAILAAAMAAGLMVLWVLAMQRVNMGKRLPLLNAFAAAAVISGFAAFAFGTGIFGSVLAGLGILVGAGFLALGIFLSALSKQTPAVTVGAPLLSFTALDEHGERFDIASLLGAPILLKFFRGHWCPYCMAELRRWSELKVELESRGVQLVAICVDTPEQIREAKHKHGLEAVMLSDTDLAVTRLFNLENTTPLLKPSGVRRLPIPTTILVDSDGIVRWIDQADDYRVRSQPDRVLRALREGLAPEPSANHRARRQE